MQLPQLYYFRTLPEGREQFAELPALSGRSSSAWPSGRASR